jgi:hypothetical protein
VIAAYGDAYLRERPKGRWMKLRNQVGVGVPGRPWTYRRLEVELYRILDADI